MDRRKFLRRTTAAVALAAAAPAMATPPGALSAPVPRARIPRIGVLGDCNPLSWILRSADFELECRWADESGRRLPDLAAELISLEVDAIVAAGARAARAAAHATPKIPIVFVIGGDPLDEGLVASFTRPGGNVTGLCLLSDAQLSGRRLAVLRDAVPRLARLGVLQNPDNALHAAAIVETRRVAARSGVIVRAVEARFADSLDAAFAVMTAARVDAFVLLPDAMFSMHADRVVEIAEARQLPGIYPAGSFAHAGGLMSLHGDSADVIGRVAARVGQILDGARPATLPVQRLDSLELTINLKAAAAFGLVMPPALLARADALLRH